jgi:TonB family protein
LRPRALLARMVGGPGMVVDNNEPKINFDGLKAGPDSRRRSQLLLALTLLLAALGLVVLRNRQFWTDSLGLEEIANKTTLEAMKKSEGKAGPAAVRKASAKPAQSAAATIAAGTPAAPEETVLAPLQVDVTYASGQHKTLIAHNSAVQVDVQKNSVAIPSSTASSATEMAGGTGLVRFSPGTAAVVLRRVDPVYPLLAQQEHVQGSVVLQARIDKDGNVQAVQVVSGPAILTSAALEAVKQWRFKPHYEGSQPAATQTRITVNFTISAQ